MHLNRDQAKSHYSKESNPRMSINSRKFRDDINGLRAWAVIAVILYHFGVSGFTGGFVGVDIFFAISGFLMTGIVVECSGLMKPDTHLGENARHIEVSDDQATSCLFR